MKAVHYNFAKFPYWPEDVPAAEPILMCVLGDGAVADALLQAVTGRTIGRHPIVTSGVVAVGSTRACHVLYVSGIPASQAGQLVAGLRDVPVLTLSDVEGFTNVGGIAQFFFEHGRLRFKIRLDAAKRARLIISSKLLILAKSND